MVRIIFFFAAVAALGFGFAWFADRPGDVTLSWQGTEYQTSLMVVLTAVVALVATILIAWWIISAVIRSPAIINRFFKNRRRDRGYNALSQGLIAAGYGDSGEARKLARESRKLLGAEPLVELLDAQTLLLEGNRDNARQRFETMLDDERTRLVALRGLYLEAERQNEALAARHYAEQAAQELPGLAWAGNAMMKFHSIDGDWEAALRNLENMRASGRMTKEEAGRKRAVLLTAQAFSEERADPEAAAKHAKEANRLAPDLVPAAIVGANALVRLNDLRRAARLLESVWKKAPHPEIADAYVHLRSGDSVLDRLKRARKLAGMRAGHAEGEMAIAEAAIAAGQWAQARKVMTPLVKKEPGERACLIMADLEEGEYGDRGRMRAWLSRAVRATKDPAWVADGFVSDHWLPVSPVTGEIDAFEWKVPVAAIGGPAEMPEVEGLAEPLPEQPPLSDASPIPAEVPEAIAVSSAAAAAVVIKPSDQTIDDTKSDDAAAEPEDIEEADSNKADDAVIVLADTQDPGNDKDAEASAPAPEQSSSDDEDKSMDDAPPKNIEQKAGAEIAEGEGPAGSSKDDTAEDGEKPAGPTPAEKNVFPFGRPPDDPGVDPAETTEEPKRFKLF